MTCYAAREQFGTKFFIETNKAKTGDPKSLNRSEEGETQILKFYGSTGVRGADAVPVGGIERREGRRTREGEAEGPDIDPNSSVKRREGLKIRLV